jgi:hypothetical protein
VIDEEFGLIDYVAAFHAPSRILIPYLATVISKSEPILASLAKAWNENKHWPPNIIPF